MTEQQPKKKFEPKTPVNLDPPKDDPITLEHLAKCDGELSCSTNRTSMAGIAYLSLYRTA